MEVSMVANGVAPAGYPGYADTKFEQNMVDRINVFRAAFNQIDPGKISSDVLQRIEGRIEKAVDEMRSQGDGYTAAEKDKVRGFLDRAGLLLENAKAEQAAYVPPQPAPAPVQPEPAPEPAGPPPTYEEWLSVTPQPVRESYPPDTTGDIMFAIDSSNWSLQGQSVKQASNEWNAIWGPALAPGDAPLKNESRQIGNAQL
jgi:hypothetical protein